MRSEASPARVLLLAGTGEGRAIAARLAADPAVRLVVSLAGRTSAPAAPADGARVRTGGFGGAEGLAAYLRAEGIDVLLDATHPFAATISRNAAMAARAAGVPLLRLERPPWRPVPGDRWTEVDDLPAAAAALAPESTVFLTVGSGGFAPFAVRTDVTLLVRAVEPPADAPPNARIVIARGPFDAAAEAAFMARNAVDVLVTRNAGGAATAGKIAAARELGLPVVIVRRPAGLPPADAADVPALLARLSRLLPLTTALRPSPSSDGGRGGDGPRRKGPNP